MAQQKSTLITSAGQSAAHTKKRSALGIGVTTLVTIMTVLLMVAFAVLSLVSAQSNLRLSNLAVEQAQLYYVADNEATQWYAELDAFVASLDGSPSSFEDQLKQAGYVITNQESDELRVSKEFSMSDTRSLAVTIQVNDDKTTTIRQWQT